MGDQKAFNVVQNQFVLDEGQELYWPKLVMKNREHLNDNKTIHKGKNSTDPSDGKRCKEH